MTALNSLGVVVGAVYVGVGVAAGISKTGLIPLEVCCANRPGCTSVVE